MCGGVSMPVSDIGRSCKKKEEKPTCGDGYQQGGTAWEHGHSSRRRMPNRWILVYIWIANVRPVRGHARLPVEVAVLVTY